MSMTYGGAHLDWPLSRDEKKYHIMQLYDRELQARDALSIASQTCPSKGEDRFADGRNARLSDASTADTEHSSAMQPLCGDQLDPIKEELDASILAKEINAAVNATAAGPARSIAQRLRLAVTSAVNATLRDLECHPADPPPHGCDGAEDASPTCRRAFSEEVSRSSSARRPSFGRHDRQRRTSRGSRLRADSRSALAVSDSDGAEGDTEEHHRQVETVPARRRWRLFNETQRVVDRTSGRRAQSCNSVMTHVADGHGKSCSTPRSHRVHPAVQADSLQDFLGESVPQCPF